jgi:hypothetical protein
MYTWIWAHTGQRLFLIVFAHATVNAPMFFWEEISNRRGSTTGAALSAWYHLEILYALTGCALVLFARKWWLQRIDAGPVLAPLSPAA